MLITVLCWGGVHESRSVLFFLFIFPLIRFIRLSWSMMPVAGETKALPGFAIKLCLWLSYAGTFIAWPWSFSGPWRHLVGGNERIQLNDPIFQSLIL